MNSLLQISDNDYSRMAYEIEELKSKDDKELYQALGNALYDNGFSTPKSKRSGPESAGMGPFGLIPCMYDMYEEPYNITEAVKFVSDPTPISKTKAEREGKRFWKQMQDKLKEVICTDKNMQELLADENELADYLKQGIPLLLAALGIAALSPLWLSIVAIIFALIIKVGFKIYCAAYIVKQA
jgi:hypothetical protein